MASNFFLDSSLTAINAIDVDLRVKPDEFLPSVEARGTFGTNCWKHTYDSLSFLQLAQIV
jgi:hypothetical protein